MISLVPHVNRAELTPVSQRRVLVLAGPSSVLPEECEHLLRQVKEHRVSGNLQEAGPLSIYDLVVADYDTLTSEAKRELETSVTGVARRKLLIVSSPMGRPELANLLAQGVLTNCLTRLERLEEQDFVVTCQKLLRRDIFGFERYFLAGTPPVEARLSSSDDRPKLLKQVEEFAMNASGGRERIATRFVTLAEEFLTNALYNAPVDAHNRHCFAQLPRTETVELPETHPVVLRMAADDNRIGISVLDGYGTLTRDRVLAELTRCFQMDYAEVARKAGGAGVGLYTVFLSASHFIVNLAPGRATEMIGLIELGGSHRDFLARGTSFNLFQLP